MKRRYDDEDERPSWAWRLTKGILAGLIVSGVAAAAVSIFILPPPEPPPPTETAETAAAEAGTEPTVIDGIEVATQPAYHGLEGAGPDAPDAETAATPAAPAGPVELDGPALVVNSVEFEAPPETPLIAVVIDDAGANPVLHDSLFALDMPLTIGVVSGGSGDRVTAQAAWDAGFEIVAQLPFAMSGESEGAALEYGLAPDEAAARTQLLIRRLPMAVAAARPMATPVPPEPGMLEGIMDTLGPLGFAWLEHGAAEGSVASASGLEAIFAVSRFTIPAGAEAADAHALLDRAAASAGEAGAAVVMAPAEEPVLLALQLWAGAGEAALAPLSAVIRRQNGGDALPEAADASDPGETAEAGEPAN